MRVHVNILGDKWKLRAGLRPQAAARQEGARSLRGFYTLSTHSVLASEAAA